MMGKFKEVLLDAEDALRKVGKLISETPELAGRDGHVDELMYAMMDQHTFAFMVSFAYEADEDTHAAHFIVCEGLCRQVERSDYGLACYKALNLTAEVPMIMAALAEEQA